MRWNVFTVLDQILHNQELIKSSLNQIIRKENITMADLTALTEQVARIKEVDLSAIALIKGIAAQLAAAATDPIAIAALANQLRTSADDLAAAIVENTPAA